MNTSPTRVLVTYSAEFVTALGSARVKKVFSAGLSFPGSTQYPTVCERIKASNVRVMSRIQC